jgi:4-diphosphocytidyl-2-C-methyl-D-erythritol kinase
MPNIPLAVRACAKVNLFLNITGRRDDGYHTLDSLFAFCGLSDLVILRLQDELVFDPPFGPFAGAVEHDGDNLVMRAAELLRREAGVAAGARISLDKHIPVAAGLGGGSADAAAALAGLNVLWSLNWPVERLEKLSEALGADVPACVRNVPVYARGIGEWLEDAPPLPRCGVLLVNPGVATPTPAVFSAFKRTNPQAAAGVFSPLPERFGSLDRLVSTIAPRGNDLLDAALDVTPEIGAVLGDLRALPGVVHAGLSGSGATCFALFATRAKAHAASRSLGRKRPDWWRWSGGWA